MALAEKRKFYAERLIGVVISALIMSGWAMPASAKPDDSTPMAELKSKCAAGDVEYCVQVAENYKEGNLVKKDKSKAFGMFKTYCAQNNMTACAHAGSAYFNGEGTAKNFELAVRYNTKACDADSARGCNNLGLVYYKDHGSIKQDYTKAYDNYKKSCDLGFSTGCLNLGNMYYYGKGREKNAMKADAFYTQSCVDDTSCNLAGIINKLHGEPKKALPFFKISCEQYSNGSNCAEAAYIYEADKDYQNGLLSHDKGCDHGFAHSCAALGFYYKKGWAVDLNFNRAVSLLGGACESSQPDYWGCEQAGHVYQEADEVYAAFDGGEFERWYGYKATLSPDRSIKSDGKKSAYYYNIACNGGLASACNSLGFLYHMGSHGLVENQKLATSTYLKGCEIKGDTGTNCYEAGRRFLIGRGASKKPKKAISLFEKGCSIKDVNACYELGLIYQNGKYRPKNLARAEQIYADNCNQDKPRSTRKTCVAMAEIYSEKNKFLKADSLYKKLCKNNGGGTNCDIVILDRQEHFCKLGKTQSCDDSYVFSLIEAARKN